MTDAHHIVTGEEPLFDASALDRLKRFGGRTLLDKMITLFLEAAPVRIAAARAALARNEVADVELALHSLKSSSAQLGAVRMQRLSAQGEQQARTGSLDGLLALTDELDHELARAREWLITARDEGKA
jgi:HPt (histidine-containing phosphotransfer) domain-containing protein